MESDKVSGWERLAGITSAIAVLAWLGTLSMWTAQLVSWLVGATVPHPSVIGIARTMVRWFGFDYQTWADRPYEGLSLYTVLKHAYLTSTCLVVAAVFSAISVFFIVRDDRAHAVPPFDDGVPRSEASPP